VEGIQMELQLIKANFFDHPNRLINIGD
jgi:hypothetical protein